MMKRVTALLNMVAFWTVGTIHWESWSRPSWGNCDPCGYTNRSSMATRPTSDLMLHRFFHLVGLPFYLLFKPQEKLCSFLYSMQVSVLLPTLSFIFKNIFLTCVTIFKVIRLKSKRSKKNERNKIEKREKTWNNFRNHEIHTK